MLHAFALSVRCDFPDTRLQIAGSPVDLHSSIFSSLGFYYYPLYIFEFALA